MVLLEQMVLKENVGSDAGPTEEKSCMLGRGDVFLRFFFDDLILFINPPKTHNKSYKLLKCFSVYLRLYDGLGRLDLIDSLPQTDRSGWINQVIFTPLAKIPRPPQNDEPPLLH